MDGTIINVASDLPSTVSPHSLLIPPSSSTAPYMSTSPNSAPIPAPPNISTSRSASVSPAKTVISRPAKRYVRPRATSDEEKEQRLKERKLANRTAAKLSRDKQKHAMEQARLENDRLKSENADLRSRIATLEQRMQALESQHQRQPTPPVTETEAAAAVVGQEETQTSVSTHQSARPMYPEPQCPTTLVLFPTFSSPQRLTQTRLVVYALQILMHSFVLSLTFLPHLLPHQTSTWTRWISSFHPFSPLSTPPHRQRQRSMTQRWTMTKTSRLSSRWMLAQTGYATPNRDDLSGAVIRSAGMSRGEERRMRLRMLGKESLRMVRRDGRRDKGSCIRLIIKKAGHRMNK